VLTYILVTHADGCSGGKVFNSICLSVCLSAPHLKNRCTKDHQTWHTNVQRGVLEIHSCWGQKVKGQGHESQKQCRRGSV